MLDWLTAVLIGFYIWFELWSDGTEPGVFPYLIMFSAALLMTLVGALKTFAPRLLLRFGRWQRRKMGAPLGALEDISEIESSHLGEQGNSFRACLLSDLDCFFCVFSCALFRIETLGLLPNAARPPQCRWTNYFSEILPN
jgi:hypothetical protein